MVGESLPPEVEVAVDGATAAWRFVAVAIDAAGPAGARAYTYHVPAQLVDLAAGEAVLVEYGRRRALGVVLGEASPEPGMATKPILGRVRSDGPLLPPLQVALANEVAAHYLAPPAAVIRAMLPPGLLERLELAAVAEATGGEGGPGEPGDPSEAALLEAIRAAGAGGVAVDALPLGDGRAVLLRRLRSLSERGLARLEWRLLAGAARPRLERRVRLSEAGRQPAGGTRLGPRQRALLAELAGSSSAEGVPATSLVRRHGDAAVAGLVRRGLLEVERVTVARDPLAARPPGPRGARPPGAALLAEQATALALAREAIDRRDPTPILLDGATGAGKTAVYVEAIAAALARGRTALVLVPEIAMAVPLVDRLRADLGAEVALLHSGLSGGERADEWRRIRAGAVDVVVGTRIALLAPLGNPGVIVVDEEHDASYKQDRTPRYQARDVALRLGRLAGAAVLLGSATPAVESVGLARSGVYRRVSLVERASGRAPAVEIVDLRAELAAGNRGLVSARLAAALASLDRGAGDRAILLINRRGAASVVLCRDCGHVEACPDCERPLVYHAAGMTLRCHHCGRGWPVARRCPACGSPRIRYLGGGTERLEREVAARFPALRVGRLDRDVVERRGAAQRVIDAFAGGQLDVLVGTSLVAKGLDVPEVTLVGVVSADVALNLPDERAAERTYQLLAQAIGRAGRGVRPGRGIIQTYLPDHPAIVAVARGEAAAFYDTELELRRRFGSPPFGELVKLTVALEDRAVAEAEAERFAAELRARAAARGVRVAVVGPAPAYVARRGGRWRWHVVLRGERPAGLLDGGVAAPWSADVDPESLL